MDGTDNGGVTTESILAILGAKEVENQILRQQATVLNARVLAQHQRITELTLQLESLAEPPSEDTPE